MEYFEERLSREFLSIINNRSIYSVYQPIVCLRSGQAIGYEALSRVKEEHSPFKNPEHLFSYAKQINLVWDLDMLCRHEAIRGAKNIGDKYLFLNIDSEIINDPKFKKGFTKELLLNHKIQPNQIVFEITEHTAINDFGVFNLILDNYRGQGYKVAIDDAGNGHSGLRLMTETRPNFIKLDMHLIRNIDKEIIKKQLIKSFVRFAEITGIKLIAEGIETKEELKSLIGIGVHFGQGYFIQRPQAEIKPIDIKIIKLIQDLNNVKAKMSTLKHRITIGDIARCDTVLMESDLCSKANEIFTKDISIHGIIVCKEKSVIGLIMRNKFYYKMLQMGNESAFFMMLVSSIMDRGPLTVESTEELMEVANMSVSRKEDELYDYIIVTENGQYFGLVPVAILLYAMVALGAVESTKAVDAG